MSSVSTYLIRRLGAQAKTGTGAMSGNNFRIIHSSLYSFILYN